MKQVRVVMNPASANSDSAAEAIRRMAAAGRPVEVVTTQEQGEAARLAEAAERDGVDVLVAGGGDGTLHDIVNGLFGAIPSPNLSLAVLPLGTANDFAEGCGIPADPYEALLLAATGEAVAVDVLRANDIYYLNAASVGFGAEVTLTTPQGLKRLMGGAAYKLVGVLSAAKMASYACEMRTPDGVRDRTFFVLAVSNGSQTGGGSQVAPRACLDDGLMDVLVVKAFRTVELGQVVAELKDIDNPENKLVHYRQVPWLEITAPDALPFNLDGEPHQSARIRFSVAPRCVRVVLPEGCPLIACGP